MQLTKEQKEYVMKHQRSAEDVKKVAEIAGKFVERYPSKEALEVTPEELSNILLIANIGEHHLDMSPNGVNIYSPEYGAWGEEERKLNASRGSKSVEMAQEIGIGLTPKMIDAIEATSKGKSTNLMALLMKAAQTYKAVQQPRWSRGVKKEAAKNFEEVEEILREELEFMAKGQEIEPEAKEHLLSGIIESARATYSIEKVAKEGKSMASLGYKELQDRFYNYEPLEEQPMETMEFWNEFLSGLSLDEVHSFENELTRISPNKDSSYMINDLVDLVKSYQKNNLEKREKSNIADAVRETTDGVSIGDVYGLLDDMKKDKNRGPENP